MPYVFEGCLDDSCSATVGDLDGVIGPPIPAGGGARVGGTIPVGAIVTLRAGSWIGIHTPGTEGLTRVQLQTSEQQFTVRNPLIVNTHPSARPGTMLQITENDVSAWSRGGFFVPAYRGGPRLLVSDLAEVALFAGSVVVRVSLRPQG